MLFYMDSKVFFRDYLNRETDEDILHANYIVPSTRIRVRSHWDNVAIVHNILYPRSEVMVCDDEEKMCSMYFKQLDEEAKGFLAAIILASIKDGSHFIFLNTRREKIIPYLRWIQEYVLFKFSYPVYNYETFCRGGELDNYSEKEVRKKCKRVLKEVQQEEHHHLRKTEAGQKKLMEGYKKMSKKQLRKVMKEKGLLYDGLNKGEMLDVIREFL